MCVCVCWDQCMHVPLLAPISCADVLAVTLKHNIWCNVTDRTCHASCLAHLSFLSAGIQQIWLRLQRFRQVRELNGLQWGANNSSNTISVQEEVKCCTRRSYTRENLSVILQVVCVGACVSRRQGYDCAGFDKSGFNAEGYSK